MRIILTFISISLWLCSFGLIQESSDDIPNCEQLTFKTVNKLADSFKNNQLDSFDILINNWIKDCGISEYTQRLIILKNINDKKTSAASIQTYFENNFQYVLRNRMYYSKKINYGYIYSDNKAYYGYVPLRHAIDSIMIEISMNLLKRNNLSPDEKLICIMFSSGIDFFNKEIKKQTYNESYIKKHLLKNYRDDGNNLITSTFYTGMFRPININDIFSISPMLGVTISSPLNNKLIVELGIKFRMNINDDSFYYYALQDTNFVNSDVSIFFGGLFGYKIFENEKLILVPKFGLGLESVSTKISEKKKNTQDITYHNIETIHLSFGLSAMTPVFKKSYLGLGINYHYCSYQLDKNLLTKFDNNLMSAEIFWRF